MPRIEVSDLDDALQKALVFAPGTLHLEILDEEGQQYSVVLF